MLGRPLGRNERTRTRNRALLVVMWRAGLRVSEALGLRMDDLRPDEGLILVRLGHASLESTDKCQRKIGANEAVAVFKRGAGSVD
mgnify:CR=1 FL=1